MVGQIDDLLRIPGVGPSIRADLHRLGIREIAGLRGRNPESLYSELCTVTGESVDRCVLYVFRCAVYFASEPRPDPELLKWWSWKDRANSSARRPDVTGSFATPAPPSVGGKRSLRNWS